MPSSWHQHKLASPMPCQFGPTDRTSKGVIVTAHYSTGEWQAGVNRRVPVAQLRSQVWTYQIRWSHKQGRMHMMGESCMRCPG